MNILLLTFAYLPSIGGVQRCVHDLARELTRRGHRVKIVADAEWSGVATPGRYSSEPCDVLMMRIPPPFNWEYVPKLRSIWRDACNLLRLAVLCRRSRIDVIHCHLINVDTRYGVLLKKLLGIRLVVTLHGNETSSWIAGKPHRIEYVRNILACADAVSALTQGQIDDALRLEPKVGGRIVRIPNPVDVAAIRAAVDQDTTLPVRPYIVYVGRFVECKSLDLLIEAYHRVLAGNPHFSADLVLVGGGELEEQLRRQARQSLGSDRIHFAGERLWGQSLRLIEKASALVLASHDDEGCPLVVLEAMALGTPIIVSDNPRLVEMISAGVTGQVFPRRDAVALQACLERIPLDNETRVSYADACLRRLEERHNLDHVVSECLTLYQA
jgi:glycosyltransferase involved in cell wall biosynthesis